MDVWCVCVYPIYVYQFHSILFSVIPKIALNSPIEGAFYGYRNKNKILQPNNIISKLLSIVLYCIHIYRCWCYYMFEYLYRMRHGLCMCECLHILLIPSTFLCVVCDPILLWMLIKEVKRTIKILNTIRKNCFIEIV